MSLVRKRGSKIGGIIAIVCLVIGLIFVGIVMLVNQQLVKNEIKEVIENKGGKVTHVQKIKLEYSPFLETMESREGKRSPYPNKFYKINYVINNNKCIAWFRSVNGIFTIKGETTDFYKDPIKEIPANKELIKNYGERWIFE